MNEVGRDDFGCKPRNDAAQQHGGFGDIRANEIEGGSQDDDKEDVVDQACESCQQERPFEDRVHHHTKGEEGSTNSGGGAI